MIQQRIIHSGHIKSQTTLPPLIFLLNSRKLKEFFCATIPRKPTWRMTFPESTFWYCSADTVPFARAEFDVHGVRKRVRAYPTLIKAGKDASHPQSPPNTPGYGHVNGMNGPNTGHSLPHVRRTTAKLATTLLIDVFGPLCMTSRSQTVSFYCIIASLKLVSSMIDTVMLLHDSIS